MTRRVARTKLVSYLSSGAAWAALITLTIASCAREDEEPTWDTLQATLTGGTGGGGTGGSSGGTGGSGGGASGNPTAQQCAAKPPGVPATASCLTADKMLFNQTQLVGAGTATGDYLIGIGQQNQPPPDGYRADVCERAWLACVNGSLLPQEAAFCSSTCGGACASPSAPSQFGVQGTTTYTVVPCGSAQCWRITCPGRGCAAQVGCCATITGSGG